MPQTHKFKIEELSKGRLLLSWILFISTFCLLLFIAGVFAPAAVFNRHCKRWYRGDEDNLDSPVTPMQFLINKDPIEHESPYFSNWNQNFFFTMTIYRRPKFSKEEARIGYDIFPFRLQIVNIENDTLLQDVNWDTAKIYERRLQCLRTDLNSTFCPAPSGGNRCPEDMHYAPSAPKCGVCRITLAHETLISSEKPIYRLGLKVANKETQKWVGLMDKDIYLIETSYKYSSEAFTLFEVYFRYLLVFTSIIVTMLFWVQNRVYCEWAYWALEQKWTMILLVSLVFFNNPLFFLNIYAEHWIFPFLNTVFVNTFLIVYMMCILLFTDNLYKTHRRLSNLEFYLPKVVLLGLLWVIGIISFGLTRAKQNKDIAENDIEDIQLHGVKVFKTMSGVLLGLYFMWLFYLVIRVMGQWSSEGFEYIPRRIKFLWLVAILMLGAVAAGIFVLVLERNETMQAVEFFSLFALFNMWPYFLSYMYWPVYNRPTARPHALPRGGNNQPHPAISSADTDMDAIFDDEEDI